MFQDYLRCVTKYTSHSRSNFYNTGQSLKVSSYIFQESQLQPEANAEGKVHHVSIIWQHFGSDTQNCEHTQLAYVLTGVR